MFACRDSDAPGSPRRRIALAGIASFLAFSTTVRWSAADGPVLRIGGTGMALATIRQIGEAFAATAPTTGLRVLPSLGTAGGLAAVAAGSIDLALSARALNDTDASKGLRARAYAWTPVAFVTHPETGVQAVTLAEVARIFTGKVLAWPNGTPVRLIRREPSDADWTMFRQLSPEIAEATKIALERPGLLTAATDQDNADALERLQGAFGTMSIGQMRAEARRVVPLALDGKPPTLDELVARRYQLSRTLYTVWRDPPGPDLSRFLEFLAGSRAAEILTQLGHIPLAGAPT